MSQQPLGYAPRQPVAPEGDQRRQVGQAAQLQAESQPVNRLSRSHHSPLRSGQAAQLRRNARPSTRFRGATSDVQVGQAAQLRRNRARQPVVAKATAPSGWTGRPAQAESRPSTGCRRSHSAVKVGEVAQLRRNRARQLVAAELTAVVRLDRPPSSGGIAPVNPFSLENQLPSGWTGWPSSGGIAPVNPFSWRTSCRQVGQAAQLRRNLARQLVAAEVQRSDTAVAVRGDAVPLIEGPVAQPVRPGGPASPFRGVVEGDQRRPVSRSAVGQVEVPKIIPPLCLATPRVCTPSTRFR